MKRFLAVFLSLALVLTAFFSTAVITSQAATVMTAREFVAKAIDIATNYKTLYVMGCFGAPLNAANKPYYTSNYSYNMDPTRTAMINAASDDTFGFDCVCLIKGILWGWNGNVNARYGGAVYASNGVPDINDDGMIAVCSEVTTDFSNIIPGEAVWMSGHIGIYIGNNLAVECSPAWENDVQITACNAYVNGYNTRWWTKHGKLPYIDYSDTGVTTISLNSNSVNLDLAGTNTKTVTATVSGDYAVLNKSWDSSVADVTTTDTNGGISISVTGKKLGTTNLVLQLKDASFNTIAQATLNIKVTRTATFYYNTQGGTTIPSFTVAYGNQITITNTVPQKRGYIFGGWNVRRSADTYWATNEATLWKLESNNKILYRSGYSYTYDESWTDGLTYGSDYTFYAIWSECPHNGCETNVVEPTYTHEGYTVHYCPTCGWSYLSNYVPPLVTIGNVDSSEGITVVDALFVLQMSIGTREITDEQMIAGDVNGDGQISSTDALLVLQYSVEMITKFPVQG